jgi:hypothetical protein
VGACLKARKGYLISIDRSNYTVTKLPYSHGYEVREREREREREKTAAKAFFPRIMVALIYVVRYVLELGNGGF